MQSLFCKTISSQVCKCAKKDAITGVIYVNIFFHFYFFVSEKTKAATGDIL